MSIKIHVLPEHLTNKIAAGEVVERPSSVVKELLENSIDAGCGEVTVEIETGGKKLIRVTDDGCGMSREDALLALERHATSKIRSDADLFSLVSLGFRGEALPSIISVCRFVLATRIKEEVEGTEIYAEGGRIKEVRACGMAEGTVIEVRNLFFNTPARLKFLRSVETEEGHIGELITRIALSRPDIRFTFINNGKTGFRLLQGDLISRISSLLGSSLAAALFPLQHEDSGIAITGFASRPDCSRSSASSLYTYVNGRFIRDKVVQHAILQSYRNVLERGRYPVVVMFIHVPPGEVDVNVHPTKHEVRFREQRRVHDAILNALQTNLATAPWLNVKPASQPLSSVSQERIAMVRESLAQYHIPQRQQTFHVPPPSVSSSACVEQKNAPTTTYGFFSGLTVIGQYNALYIVCQSGSDLILVDQHAAHERVAFEKLKKQYSEQSVSSQGLLFPETVELSLLEAAVVKEQAIQLEKLGFVVEPFGGATWVIQAVPHLVASRDYVKTFRDTLEELHLLDQSKSVRDVINAVLTKIACHSVVRGQHLLGREEIAALFRQMDESDFAGNCPHGRPVYIRMQLGEIEKMFRRS